MSSQPQPLPYRDINNQTVAYAQPSNTAGPIHTSPYDSDYEPLITGTHEELDADSVQRFTATGRPMPAFKANALQSMGGDLHSMPQLLPKRYTDDSIIPAIVVDIIPSRKTTEEDEKKKGRRASFLKKLKGDVSPKKDETKGLTKVVYMPRRDYLKWFARDQDGVYIGTEAHRKWDEDELEDAFKQYKPVVEKKKGYRPPAC